MANESTSLVTQGGDDTFANHKRVVLGPLSPFPGIFGTNAAELLMAKAYPIGYNTNTEQYAPWMAPDPTTVLVDGGFTGGTWGITIDGIDIANTVLAWNATAALVAATIKASMGVEATVVLATGEYTITFGAEDQLAVLPTVTVDVTQLTGGTAAATVTDGTASYGTHRLQGVVYPDPVQLDETNTVQGNIMIDGEIALGEMTSLVEAGDVAALTAAAKAQTLASGLKVHDLPNIHKEVA
jgi:hypothetical protein